jgi:dihydrolipoamide dehydrogenase
VAFFNPFLEVGPFTDPEIQAEVRRVLAQELDLRLGVAVTAAEAKADGVTLHWRDEAGAARSERFAQVLLAAGRRPDLAGLGLENTGLALDPRTGLPAVDAGTTQCGDAPIFLAGDVDGTLPLQHEAADEGRIAGDNAMRWPDVRPRERRTPLAVAFTDPQMAMVGLSFAQLPPGGHAIGAANYASQGRARAMGVNRGLIRLYAELGTCRLLGGELFGPAMEHMAHLLGWAVQQRMSVPRALEMPFYHPTLEGGLKTALRDLAGALRALDQCRPEDLADSPGA